MGKRGRPRTRPLPPTYFISAGPGDDVKFIEYIEEALKKISQSLDGISILEKSSKAKRGKTGVRKHLAYARNHLSYMKNAAVNHEHQKLMELLD